MPDSPFHVARPCDEDFASMPGGRRRHCARCQHAVHDLSSMTRAQALRLLRARAGEDLCVSYRADARGAPQFLPPRRLRRRGRAAAPAALSLALAACHSGHPSDAAAAGENAPAVEARSAEAPVEASASAAKPSTFAAAPALRERHNAPARGAASPVTSQPPTSSPARAEPHAAPMSAQGGSPEPAPTPAPKTTNKPAPKPAATTAATKTDGPSAVDCLLDPNLPGCEYKPRTTGKITGDPDTRGLPHKPSFADIKRMFHDARPKAKACGRGIQPPGSKARIKLRFRGSTGALIDATVLTAELPPAVQRCMVAAFQGRTLPPFRVAQIGISVQIHW